MDARAVVRDLSSLAAKPRFALGRKAAMIGAPILVVIGTVVAFQVLMATAPKPEKSDEGPQPIAVEIATARAEVTTLSVTTQGEIRSKTQAEIAAQVTGQIVFVAPELESGAAVRQGDVLARIDPAEYELAVQRSRSQVARAREALSRARSEAALAEEDWKELGLAGAPSDLTMQRPQVNSAQADLRTAEAAVKESELNLARTEVRAPFDGRVMARRADVGDFIAAGAPVASIFAVDVAQARIPLTDEDLAALGLAPGFAASERAAAPTARLSAVVGGARREWRGTLTLVEAAVDPQTRLVYGLVEVADPFGAAHAAPLAPGIFAEVSIEASESERLVSFPRGALKKNQHVYVVDADGAIWAREVKPAMADGDRLYVRAGIEDGERVVVSYLPSPRDGMKVRDLNAPAPPAPDVATADTK